MVVSDLETKKATTTISVGADPDVLAFDAALQRLWSQAEVATDFRQQEPNEGEPASEKTEVRLLFDDKNLYVGVHAFDGSYF